MARHSVFADRGGEVIELYPVVEVVDRRGNTRPQPSTTPIVRRASVSIQRGDISETADVAVELLRVVVRDLPASVNSWARVHLRGQDWDFDKPPAQSGWSKATKHWEMTLRSRNGVGSA